MERIFHRECYKQSFWFKSAVVWKQQTAWWNITIDQGKLISIIAVSLHRSWRCDEMFRSLMVLSPFVLHRQPVNTLFSHRLIDLQNNLTYIENIRKRNFYRTEKLTWSINNYKNRWNKIQFENSDCLLSIIVFCLELRI